MNIKMSRRHFINHLTASAATIPTLQFISEVRANATKIKKNQKACILVWLGGGPPTIDMWDLKPNSPNGGEFKPISTAGDGQICELFPKLAKQMNDFSLIRSMSTREADHTRGRYYMHTAYVPNPTVTHPTFGSVVSKELGEKRSNLEIPAFVAIGGNPGSPGFLGMTHSPFSVGPDGRIRNANRGSVDRVRLQQRLSMLNVIESNFIESNRGDSPQAHKDVYSKAVNLMTSKQMEAFQVTKESPKIRAAYGENNFGRGLLMARRLVEQGVPFIEVNFPGSWDMHSTVFNRLRTSIPQLDSGLSALTTDLKQRGLLGDVTIVCIGEFGRTPRINQNTGRDHWASSWSALIGGGNLKNGQVIGKTDKDGTRIEGKSYLPGDLWATVANSLGIPLSRVYQSKRGRPMKIVNGGTPIKELVG